MDLLGFSKCWLTEKFVLGHILQYIMPIKFLLKKSVDSLREVIFLVRLFLLLF